MQAIKIMAIEVVLFASFTAVFAAGLWYFLNAI
jgi:hypothetical protein